MSDLALYRRLLRQARPYWLHLAVLFCIGLLASPVALLNPVPLKIVVDSVLGTRPLSPALQALLPAAIAGSRAALLAAAVGLLLAVAALAQLQALANKFMQAYVGERLVLSFRTRLGWTGSWRSWRSRCHHRCSCCRACIAPACGASTATSRSSRARRWRSSRR